MRPTRIKHGRCLPRRGWQYRAAAKQAFYACSPARGPCSRAGWVAALISSIPGIGRPPWPRILGHLGDVRRLKNAKALAAFPGVTPKHHTSDTSIKGRSVIRRTGSTSLRAALFMPSMVACRLNPILNQFAERLLATGLPRKAVICAVMHTLTHLIYGVIRTGKPFDANYLSNRLAIQNGI